MSTATVTTDINIGPFKIPANGQNMIMNNYAQRKKIKVEFVIPEPMMSNQLATIQWCHKDYKFSKVILCVSLNPYNTFAMESPTKTISQ